MVFKVNNIRKKKSMNKKAQVTIFVIIGILIIAAVILIYFLYDGQIRSYIEKQTLEPNQEIEECISNSVREINDKLIENAGYLGGSQINKTFEYKEVPYLCYTGNFYAKCVPTEPVIVEFVKKEIENEMDQKIDNCFLESKENLEADGYSVEISRNKDFSAELTGNGIKTSVSRKMIISKNEQTKEFNSFLSVVQSPIYDFIVSAQEIVRQESIFCNSEYENLIRLNPKIQIGKFQTGDDVRIYTLTDVPTEKTFRFAIRGCVLPTPA